MLWWGGCGADNNCADDVGGGCGGGDDGVAVIGDCGDDNRNYGGVGVVDVVSGDVGVGVACISKRRGDTLLNCNI